MTEEELAHQKVCAAQHAAADEWWARREADLDALREALGEGSASDAQVQRALSLLLGGGV